MTDHDYDYFDDERSSDKAADVESDQEYLDYPDPSDCILPSESEEDYDAEDVDCESCGLKFWIRPSLYGTGENKKPWPTQCERCVKGLPPLYEY